MVKLDLVLDSHLIEESSKKYVPASKAKRLLNALLDYLGIIILLTVFFAILILLGGEDLVVNRHSSSDVLQKIQGVLGFFAYYLIMEYYLEGKSFGKFITGTKVVMLDGQAPDLKAVCSRVVARFIPLEPLSLLWTDHRAWHDKLSGTIVVDDD